MDFHSIAANAAQKALERQKNTIATAARHLGKDPNAVKNLQKKADANELTVEDIAAAIKEKDGLKNRDNDFISQHNSLNKVEEKEDIDPNSIAAQMRERIEAVAENMELKLNHIQKNTNKSLNRQGQVGQKLKNYRKDPFSV